MTARLRRTTTLAVLGAVALLATMLATPARAQLEEGTCPPSVDTVDEGWICSLLILDTPTSSPSDGQIELWSAVLAQSGRAAVTGGIVFSDVSVEAKVRAIYQTELGREPDESGLAHWRDRVQDARTEFVAEFGIFGSAEYRARTETPEELATEQYEYYLGRDASRAEQNHWADRYDSGELSYVDIVRAIARSREAGNVRADLLYERYARRAPDPGGRQHWSARAADAGLFRTVVDFARSGEVVSTLGRIGMDLAVERSGSDPEQDIIVAPQEVVTTSTGEPVEISVLGRRDGGPVGTVDLTLFPCDNVTATDSPVHFADADADDLADGIASTAADQAYISEVNGQPTGGRELYVDDAQPADDGMLRFHVIAGPGPDCAVIAVIDDQAPERQLSLDADNHADEHFGVTQVIWE